MNNNQHQEARGAERFWTKDMLYSAVLFAVAAATLVMTASLHGGWLQTEGPGAALFFLAFGLFTITMGFPHPGFGHVSFDRVGQVAAILVLGPLDAAAVCGLASFVYPWKRLIDGESLRLVTMAALHNSGLMTLVVLGGGMAFVAIGGVVPMTSLGLKAVGLLLLMIISMQLINDLGMLIIFRMRGRDPTKLLTVFTMSVEIFAAVMAVLVALVYSRGDIGVTALLLLVLAVGMLILKQYAEMRTSLEALVDERTEELRQKTLELARQATQDKLTGLYNRRYADEYLERQIAQANRSGQPLTVALADIDHFKRINDRYSHNVGDRVLERVGELLRAQCRKSDIVARYGGEEFLLCFPDTDKSSAEQFCGDMRRAMAAVDWTDVVGVAGAPEGLRITMSFGLATAITEVSVTELLDEADVHLYKAKNAGRNRVVA